MLKVRILLHLTGIALITACQPPAPPSESTHESTHESTKEPASKTAIKARRDLMHQWGKAHDVIKNMHKQPDTFNAALLTEKVAMINDSKSQMWLYFNDDTKDNRVNRLVSQNRTDFQAQSDEFDALIESLYQASKHAKNINDVKPTLDKIHASCKNCHKTYKKL